MPVVRRCIRTFSSFSQSAVVTMSLVAYRYQQPVNAAITGVR